MLPDGSGGGRGGAGAEPAAATPGVPTFTSTELHKQLDAVLGKGASGTVYSLRDFPGLAAKELRLDGLDQRSIDAAKLELATLPALSHPGILRYHQAIEDGNFVYIVMDRHDGTLGSVIISHMRTREPVPRELLLSIVRQITSALAYLHGFCGTDVDGKPYQGVVHRDLKPDNVLVSEDGSRVVLADFGLCKDALRSGTTFAGTKPYMAPETLLYNSTSPTSDIWALGVIVYELATLKRPNFLEGKEPKDVFIDGWKPDLSDVKNDFIRGILERIFVLDPEKRPTARELHEMLSPYDVPADGLGAQYMVLQHKCSSLETELNEASARIAILEGDTRTKSEKITALEEALAVKASEMDSLKSVVVTQEAKVDSLKKDLEAKSNKVDVLEQTLTVKSAKIDTIDGELQTNSSKINSLESTISTQATEINALRKELEMKSNQIDALEGQCKEHLVTTKALEDKIALLTASNPQSELLLLPRLMRAAHTNSAETVRMLVESGDGIGKRDEQGRTALMHAAQQGHIEPVRLLVEKEQGLQDKNGWTALMHAVHNNHPGVVEILATHERGKRENSNRTALMIAAERGYTEIAAALAPHEKGLAYSSGNTALMLAASNAHTEAVRVLAEHEKGITDEDGHTALVHAARAGHREIAELLMEHEKDVTGWTMLMCATVLGDTDMVSQHIDKRGQKDKQGRTALILAAQNRRDDVVKLLMKHESGVSCWTNLIYAAYCGDVDSVKDNLHEKGCKDVTGMTALMWAVRREHKGVVKVLLEHEKGIRDNQNHNALYYALKNGHTETAKAILPHDDPTDENNVTALMQAAARGDAEMVELLVPLQKGMKDKDGSTALCYALRSGHLKDVDFLIEADDPADENGVTALMRAAEKGDAEMVRLLAPLQKGAKDKDGNTAFMHALKNKHTDVALLLREYEAPSWTPLMCAALIGDIKTAKQHLSDKDKKNSDGDTALMIAARAGHVDIVELTDPTDKDGNTALMRAADRNDVEAVRALIPLQKGKKATGGVTINEWPILNGTALMKAAYRGYAEVVKLLVEYESGLKDGYSYTALMNAAWNGHADCVRLLLEREKKIRTYDGKTALDIANERGHTGIVSILSE